MKRLNRITPLNHRSPVPLHVQLRERLRTVLEFFEEGEKFYSEQEIARHFNLSRGTVRRALADLTYEGLLERKSGKGTFVKKGIEGEDGEKGKNLTVGIFLPNVKSDFLREMVEKISQACQDMGCSTKLYFTHSGTRVSQACEQLDESPKREGIILMGGPVDIAKELALSLDERGYKIVFVDTVIEELPYDYVATDNVQGAMMVVKYLADLGHRRIGILINEPFNHPSVIKRLEGYQRAVRLLGLDMDEKLICNCHTRDWENTAEAAYNNISKLLSLSHPPTAIFVISDGGALGIYKALKERRINIPEDISIVGFDDDQFSRFMDPPLTTVAQPKEEIARKAVSILISRMKGIEKDKPQRVLLPPQLVIRESSMPPHTDKNDDEK